MSGIIAIEYAMDSHKYLSAYDLLSALKYENLSSDEKNKYWYLYVEILRKKFPSEEVFYLNLWHVLEASDHFFNSKLKLKVSREIYFNSKTAESAKFLAFFWKQLEEAGDLILSEKIEKKYLQLLIKRKNFNKGRKFIEQIEKSKGLNQYHYIVLIHFLLLQQNFKEISVQLIKVSGENLDPQELIHMVIGRMPSGEWKKSQYIYELYLEEESKKINDASNIDQDEIVRFLRDLYEYCVMFPNESFSLYHLMLYSIHFGKDEFNNNVLSFLNKQTERNKTYLNHEDDIITLSVALNKKISSDFRRKERTLVEKFDFATDLIHGLTLRKQTIMRLERDINFLEQAGLNKDVDRFLDQLKKIDEHNTIFYQGNFTQTDSEFENRKKIKQIYEEYLEDFNDSNHLRHNPLQDIDNLEDLFVMHLMISQFKDAQEVLDEIWSKVNKDDIESILRTSYYDVSLLMKMKDYKNAISKIDHVFKCYTLDEDNFLAFLYDKAESLFLLSQNLEALNCFKEIIKIRPDYRLASERIDVILES